MGLTHFRFSVLYCAIRLIKERFSYFRCPVLCTFISEKVSDMKPKKTFLLLFLLSCMWSVSFTQNLWQKYSVTRDSLIRKHPDSLTYRIDFEGDSGFREMTIVYKQKKHWVGIYLSVTPITPVLDPEAKIIIVSFPADSLVKQLRGLGIDSLKQITETQLQDYLNKDIPKNDSTAIFLLPESSHGHYLSINVMGNKIAYNGAHYTNSIFQELKPVKIFNDIVVCINTNSRRYNR